jgi:translation elongation factor EF-G
LNDDYCPGIELEISDPIIPFRETILNKRLTNKIKKNKQENYEEGQTSSESEDEKTILQKADKT